MSARGDNYFVVPPRRTFSLSPLSPGLSNVRPPNSAQIGTRRRRRIQTGWGVGMRQRANFHSSHRCSLHLLDSNYYSFLHHQPEQCAVLSTSLSSCICVDVSLDGFIHSAISITESVTLFMSGGSYSNKDSEGNYNKNCLINHFI